MHASRRQILKATLATGLAGIGPLAAAQAKYDTGASDTEIVIGSTHPLSGPASSFAVIGKAMQAYFNQVNDQGGINGRKVKFILADDGYSPPQTMELTRRMVESDRVLLTAGSLGTPTQLTVARYLNQQKVPQLFVAAPGSKLASPKTFPWTINFSPSYEIEGAVYATHLLGTNAQAKVAMLFQDDEAGKALAAGFSQTLAAKGVKPVSEQSYQPTDPSIDSQIIQMKGSGADAVFLVTIPRMTALALRKIASLGWKPQVYVSAAGSSPKNALEPAGLENAVGVISSNFRKNVADARWDDDPDVQAFRAMVTKYMPGTDPKDELAANGYETAYAVHQVLKMAGNDLTRANIMQIVGNLKGFRTPLLLPGVTFDTTPDDYQGFKRLQLTRFDGKTYQPLGDLIAAP